MKAVIFEVCRNPQIKKQTEAITLSQLFSKLSIPYKLYSNDYVWEHHTIIDKSFIASTLTETDASIIHLAMHGDESCLVLNWSPADKMGVRIPADILTGKDILAMDGWKGKLIISGACSSANLARFFIDAGAKAVIAPAEEVSWINLGDFFGVIYQEIAAGKDELTALASAVKNFPEYGSYRVFQD